MAWRYVLTGDAGQGRLAQDRRSLNGKVLRLSPQQYHASTTTPTVFSIGHRNPQGLDWQPGTDRLVITDHGPSGFDDPSCCDEVDVVVEGGDYGWPQVFGRDTGASARPRCSGSARSPRRAQPSSACPAAARRGRTSWRRYGERPCTG